MDMVRISRLWLLGATFVGLGLSGCGSLSLPTLHSASDTEDQALLANTTTASPSPTVVGQTAGTGALAPGTAVVTRGTVADTVSLYGRTAGLEELTLEFKSTSRIDQVDVTPGQSVKADDVLLQTDAAELARQLDSAKARLLTSQANVEQAQATALTRQNAAAQRAASDRQAQQAAVDQAQAQVSQAQADLTTVLAGASETERRDAQTSVDTAQVALQKAQAIQDKLNAGPDADTITRAQRDVAAAQIGVDRAQAVLDGLLKGPDEFAVRAAQRDVDRAKNALTAVQAVKLDAKADAGARAAHDAAIADAQLSVQTAQDRLTQVDQGAKDADVATARQQLQTAKDALLAARNRQDSLQEDPDQTALDAAQFTIDNAQRALDNALDKQSAVASRPTPKDRAAAQDRVRLAQAALDRARNAPQADTVGSDEQSLTALQRAVEQDQAQVDTLTHDLDASRLRAPFDGVVTSVLVRPGDSVAVSKPVMILAKPGRPIVRAQLSDVDAPRIAPGQAVSVQVGTADVGNTFDGKVDHIEVSPQGGKSAVVTVNWSATPPPPGRSAQLEIVVEQHTNVLLVPKQAIKNSGKGNYVESLAGSSRRVTSVQLGLVGEAYTEIVSGVNEGQLVVIR